jgi:hypothetical protein
MTYQHGVINRINNFIEHSLNTIIAFRKFNCASVTIPRHQRTTLFIMTFRDNDPAVFGVVSVADGDRSGDVPVLLQ